MTSVVRPHHMNPAFAEAFNSRDIHRLLALYEEDAVLCTDASGTQHRGKAAIARALTGLLTLPGTMESHNNFCLESGGVALLRADYIVLDEQGVVLAQGSTAEIVRQQPTGNWLYLADHAAAMSAPSVLRHRFEYKATLSAAPSQCHV